MTVIRPAWSAGASATAESAVRSSRTPWAVCMSSAPGCGRDGSPAGDLARASRPAGAAGRRWPASGTGHRSPRSARRVDARAGRRSKVDGPAGLRAILEVAVEEVRPGLARRHRPGTPVHSAGTDVKDVGVPRPCPEIGHCRVPDVQAAAFHPQKGAVPPGHAGHGGRADGPQHHGCDARSHRGARSAEVLLKARPDDRTGRRAGTGGRITPAAWRWRDHGGARACRAVPGPVMAATRRIYRGGEASSSAGRRCARVAAPSLPADRGRSGRAIGRCC